METNTAEEVSARHFEVGKFYLVSLCKGIGFDRIRCKCQCIRMTKRKIWFKHIRINKEGVRSFVTFDRWLDYDYTGCHTSTSDVWAYMHDDLIEEDKPDNWDAVEAEIQKDAK